MLENTNRIHRLLAGAVGAMLALGVAVSAGAVPRPGDNGEVRAAAVSEVVDLPVSDARQAGDAAPEVTVPAVVEAAAPEAPTTTVAKPRTTTPTTKAPAPRPTAASASTPAPSAVALPAPNAAPAAPARVARRTPTPAEVQAAITELKGRVGGLLMLVSPTPAQIDQVGDQVCTAFDNGQSFAEVRATGLSMIPPSVTVSPSTADWAVRHAVALYCPGHANKLV